MVHRSVDGITKRGEMFLLHAFIKKTQKTPQQEVDLVLPGRDPSVLFTFTCDNTEDVVLPVDWQLTFLFTGTCERRHRLPGNIVPKSFPESHQVFCLQSFVSH
jgi:hypothetical protein